MANQNIGGRYVTAHTTVDTGFSKYRELKIWMVNSKLATACIGNQV